MQTKIVAATALVALTAFGALAHAAGEEEEENKQKVPFSELPAAVQKTIQDNLAGGSVTETTKEIDEGKTYYAAEVQKPNGEKVEIEVAEDGTLIGVGNEGEDDEGQDND